jgi:hypothetical protein
MPSSCFSGCLVDKYSIKFFGAKGATWEEMEAELTKSWGDPAYNWRGFGKPGDEDFVVILTRRAIPEEEDSDEDEDEDEDEGADSTDEEQSVCQMRGKDEPRCHSDVFLCGFNKDQLKPGCVCLGS